VANRWLKQPAFEKKNESSSPKLPIPSPNHFFRDLTVASIDNRSRIKIEVNKLSDLTKLFPHTKQAQAAAYFAELRQAGHRPVTTILDEAYLVRYYLNGKRKSFTAVTMAEAVAIQKRIESEQHYGLFQDYTKAHQTTLADLLIRYLNEVAPRNKGFMIEAYKINAWLEDAGLPCQDIAAIHKAHPNPYDRDLHIPRPSNRRMSLPCDAVAFIRKPFSNVEPDDFSDFVDERAQVAEPATIDRDLDIFNTVCCTAINKWRIHVHCSPLLGFDRPKYVNDRDRRLRVDEESRLMAAAHIEDQKLTARALGDQMFGKKPSNTKYQRLSALKDARLAVQQAHLHVPMVATFIQFQLMTGARRSETLKLTWKHVDLVAQTAFLPETKNGFSRTLPLRADLVALLRELPGDGDQVFPIPTDYLRKAWKRICEAANICTEGDDRLRIHDLRHEAISRVAEAGSRTPGGFTLLDLQAFSGHRDPRMLIRYTHLSASGLARQLDAAFAAPELHTIHHGVKRLSKDAKISMAELFAAPLFSAAPIGLTSGSVQVDDVDEDAHQQTMA